MFKLIIFIAVVCASPLVQESEQRTWADNTGDFSVEAVMVVDADDKLTADVVLTRPDGKTITVPLERLSDESKRYVRKVRRAAKRSPEAVPSPGLRELPGESTTQESKVWNWRGPDQNGIADETALMSEWPAGGPELLWTANGLGNAMSSVAIANEKIFTLGNRDGGEYLIACSLEDGSELWYLRDQGQLHCYNISK